jgi:hypothetical protein
LPFFIVTVLLQLLVTGTDILNVMKTLLVTSVADPHRKNADADADADPGKNLNADADADPDADADADSCSY